MDLCVNLASRWEKPHWDSFLLSVVLFLISLFLLVLFLLTFFYPKFGFTNAVSDLTSQNLQLELVLK